MTHRDLKPENVLLESADDNKLDLKIADFGFSCIFDPKDGLELVLGSPLYMAPELIQRQKYNEKVDIWSLGVITYMLLSGKNPFPGRDKREIQAKIVNSVVDLNKATLKTVSANAKDFIKQCLNKSVKERWSAEQLLSHDWIKEQDQNLDVDLETKKEVFNNLSEFSKATKFQKTILSVLLGLRSDKEDLQQLKIAFNKMDKDGDGSLSYKEIEASEKELAEYNFRGKWKEIIKQCDLDGDGRIDFHEFFTAAVNKQKTITRENLKYAFDTFDTNGDGNIDIEEFKTALPSTRKGRTESLKSQHSNTSDKGDTDTWCGIISEVDVNGDGVVSFDEFCKAIESFIS